MKKPTIQWWEIYHQDELYHVTQGNMKCVCTETGVLLAWLVTAVCAGVSQWVDLQTVNVRDSKIYSHLPEITLSH